MIFKFLTVVKMWIVFWTVTPFVLQVVPSVLEEYIILIFSHFYPEMETCTYKTLVFTFMTIRQ
jgi:hypothetical protein